MSQRWKGRPSAVPPEALEIAREVHRLRSALPTWEELAQRFGVSPHTLRRAATDRTPKRLVTSGGQIST